MLAITLRLFGLTILDLAIDTDSPSPEPEADFPDEVNGELSGRSIGFEGRSLVLPSVEGE